MITKSTLIRRSTPIAIGRLKKEKNKIIAIIIDKEANASNSRELTDATLPNYPHENINCTLLH
jgi:hypothetical protein